MQGFPSIGDLHSTVPVPKAKWFEYAGERSGRFQVCWLLAFVWFFLDFLTRSSSAKRLAATLSALTILTYASSNGVLLHSHLEMYAVHVLQLFNEILGQEQVQLRNSCS